VGEVFRAPYIVIIPRGEYWVKSAHNNRVGLSLCRPSHFDFSMLSVCNRRTALLGPSLARGWLSQRGSSARVRETPVDVGLNIEAEIEAPACEGEEFSGSITCGKPAFGHCWSEPRSRGLFQEDRSCAAMSRGYGSEDWNPKTRDANSKPRYRGIFVL
jgi:hypothetical protein